MFPKPTINHIPKIYRDNKNQVTEDLTDFIDSVVEGIESDLRNFRRVFDPDSVPVIMLDPLGEMFAADFLPTDSETIKRRKLRDAVKGHKNRGTWEDDVKLRVDDIAGGDAQIITSVGSDDWILVGDGLTPTSFYWAALGVDGIDDDLGIALVGEGTEIVISGNIYIDVDNSSMSSAEQTALLNALLPVQPAYFILHLGYVSMGQFIEYFSMST